MSLRIADGTHNFKPSLHFVIEILELPGPAVVQNMIGVACNLRIPQANLHVVLNFVHKKNYSHYKQKLYSYFRLNQAGKKFKSHLFL
jgi:hypothetical protein